MSGRTTRLRTVLLALLCVVSLLAAPGTAMATPDGLFGGDGTDSTGSGGGDGLGERLGGSSDSASDDDGTDDSDADADSDDDSSPLSESDSDSDGGPTASDGESTETNSDSTDPSDDPADGEFSLRSALAKTVNTTVEEATGDAERSWLEDRTDTVEEPTTGDASPVDWSSLGPRVEPTLTSDTASEQALDVEWYRASLATTTDETTAGTRSTLSTTLGGVTDDVLRGLDTVVDVEHGVGVTAPGGSSATAPAVDGGSRVSTPSMAGSTALVPEEGTVDTGASVRPAGAGTPLPPGSRPSTGLAVGLGGVAAIAAVRQGLFASTGTGLGATASALVAGVTPVVGGRSSALDRLVRMLTAFRYSRYDDSDPLEHEARADVFEVVEERPGVYLSEVAEQADLPLSTARHHVRVLEREELLTGAKVRGKRRFYPAYSADIELAAALNDDSTAMVLDALSRLGDSSVSELADELGRDPSTVTHHLQRLEEADLVVREREGRAVINRLSPEARTALEPETEPVRAESSGVVASD